MTKKRAAPANFPLKPRVFLILLCLAESKSHGYAIKEKVRRRTGGRLDMSPGTLYRTLHSLRSEGLIEETHERPQPDEDDERRRYYILTAVGRDVLRAEARRLEELVKETKLHTAEG